MSIQNLKQPSFKSERRFIFFRATLKQEHRHSIGVLGYEKKTLDEIALVEMMTIDEVVKARKTIIKKLIKTGRYND